MKMLNPVQNLFGRRNYFLIFMYEKLQQIVANMTDICTHCHNYPSTYLSTQRPTGFSSLYLVPVSNKPQKKIFLQWPKKPKPKQIKKNLLSTSSYIETSISFNEIRSESESLALMIIVSPLSSSVNFYRAGPLVHSFTILKVKVNL